MKAILKQMRLCGCNNILFVQTVIEYYNTQCQKLKQEINTRKDRQEKIQCPTQILISIQDVLKMYYSESLEST